MAHEIALRPNAEFANVPMLHDAYTKMQALPAADNRGWEYWASYHGYLHNFCWHHARRGNQGFHYDLFLPWHRAYLVYWDHAARDQNPEAIQPWWDWTSAKSHQAGIPEVYSQPDADGNPNPLASGPKPSIANDSNAGPRTIRNPGDPAELPNGTTPGLMAIADILNLSDFVDFSNQIQNIHDMVHGWVGGDMTNIVTAAFDPIFYAHHCMIDRLWYLWQIKHGTNNIPDNYLNYPLQGFDYRVRDVLDITQLGYGYASSAAEATVGGAA